jgi:CobQ-like glutamine amidotransferase family enzyme
VDGNEMSQVLSGCLRLTGRLMPITFRHRPGEMPIEGSSGNVGEIEVHGAVFTFWSDVANAELEGQLYSTTCISDLEWSNDAKVLGLVLKPTGKERGQYHRVGLFQTYTSGSYKREQPLLSRANPVGKALITKDLYKTYHKDIDKYTFTIV